VEAVIEHEALGVVCQVRDGGLHVLLWRRALAPARGRWSLPCGPLVPTETLEASVSRHLATKVDVHDLSHVEQLGTWSGVRRIPRRRVVATAYLGLVRIGIDPAVPADTVWHPADHLPETAFDHGDIVVAGVERLRAKLSYTNLGFALAPPSFTMAELRLIYRAALGRDVSVTNLQRILTRRGEIEATGQYREPGSAGGRPASLFRFSHDQLQVTDAFAVLRPR
jgi:hypothetical protein